MADLIEQVDCDDVSTYTIRHLKNENKTNLIRGYVADKENPLFGPF